MSKKRKNGRKRRTWLAIGTMAAYAAFTTGKAGHLHAQHVQAGSLGAKKTEGKQPLLMHRYDLPEGPLDDVLKSYAKITGTTINYTIPAEAIPGFRSQGAVGFLTDQQALQRILEGTGLSAQLQGKAITIQIANSQVVEVTEYATNLGLSSLPLSLVETPVSITAIPKEILAEQGVTTLRDSLRNAPGISLAAGEGGSQGDNLTIRGFAARNDIFLDGIRDFGSYYRDSFNYEQVDVLEGPAGVNFGRGSTGGVINQESKQPRPVPHVELAGNFGTDITRRFTADINEPLPDLLNGSAFRLNVMANSSNVAERDVVNNNRAGFAPTLAVGMGTPTRLTASYFYFSENDIPDYGLPWYFNGPAPVPRHNYYGFRDGNFLKTSINIGTVTAEHDWGSSMQLRNQARYANNYRDAQITEPQTNNANAGLITPSTPLTAVQVYRNQISARSNEGLLWDQMDFILREELLGMKHTIDIGAEGGRETSDPTRYTFTGVPLANLLRPNENLSFSGTSNVNTITHVTAFSESVHGLDSIELNRMWEVTGGVRWDRFDASAKQYTASTGKTAPATQTVSQATYRAALIFKPQSYGSIYFDYGTSFNPSAEALSLSASTANTPPEENESFEFGSKWDLNNGKLTLRGSIYRTTKDNARETSTIDSNFTVNAGNQRVTGGELLIQGHITPDWEVISSFTHLKSEVIKSLAYPLAVGRPLANVPANMFNLWMEHRLSHGFEVGAGTNFVDKRYATTTYTTDPSVLDKHISGYWVFNAMIGYKATEHVSFQANAYNLANRFYIDQPHPNHLVPGPGASALMGMKFTF
jgi:catecholate siderophore receptor